jgi:beta-galactosidase
MRRRDLLTLGAVAMASPALAHPKSGQGDTRPGGAAAPPAPALEASGRETILLDADWRFHRGDIPLPKVRGDSPTYESTKAGAARGAAAIKYDDSAWRGLDLPHDFVVEGPFDPDENPAQGYRPKGVAWYRKTLALDPADRGKHLELCFDGVAVNATVWVNGDVVAHSYSAYSAIVVDLTAIARYGDTPNVIAVRVDADPIEGWWYEGGGLYRHVWLVKRPPVHLITDGVYAHPRRREDGRWVVPVEASLGSIADTAKQATIDVVLLDPEGRAVARAQASGSVAPLDTAVLRTELAVETPRLWSVDVPALYQVRTRVRVDGQAADELVTPAGFRTQRFDPAQGFFLNDRPLKIQGVCIHQDHAGLGVALPDSIIEFRLRRLKALGCNAIRSSHNAPTKELLAAADRLGFLVMDENRIFNVSPDYARLLSWLVRRDRNHPCVILWSVFNEEPLQGTEAGYEMVRRMSKIVKDLDDTRPVTAAINGGMFNPVNVSQAVDVVGFNYQIKDYDRFHAAHPDLPMTSSEDTSAIMTRGEWATDMKRNLLAAYDDEFRPWGATHRKAWKAIAERPFAAGAFVWTGFDYRGEPQPFTWPSASSSFGIMDLCGFEKTAFYIHQSQWVRDRPVLHLVPHWNWAGREGQPIKVMAFANCDTVALRLNGKLISQQKNDLYEGLTWQVPYAPGRLEAIGLTGGKVVARAVVETTGAPVALRLTPDRASLTGDGRDATPIRVEAVDDKGRPVPTAQTAVRFSIEGGRIIGLGNGDANNHEPEKGDRRSLYNGLAQVIVQTPVLKRGGPGHGLAVTAQAQGLKPATARIVVT